MGYWTRAWREFLSLSNEGAAQKQETKAREHEMKAGKTFRRTKKHLKEADRAERKAGSIRSHERRQEAAHQRRRDEDA